MPRGKAKVLKYRVVKLELIWPPDKYDVITEMAKRNELSLADMVDDILDDWAALANRDLGNDSIPRVLVVPEEAKEEYHRRTGLDS